MASIAIYSDKLNLRGDRGSHCPQTSTILFDSSLVLNLEFKTLVTLKTVTNTRTAFHTIMFKVIAENFPSNCDIIEEIFFKKRYVLCIIK